MRETFTEQRFRAALSFTVTGPAPQPEPGIPARWPDTCPRCSDPINPADRIVFSRGRPIHVRCANGGDDQ